MRVCMCFVAKLAGPSNWHQHASTSAHGVREIHQRPCLTCVAVPSVPIQKPDAGRAQMMWELGLSRIS